MDALLSALKISHAPPPSCKFWFAIDSDPPQPTIREIMLRVAKHFGISMSDITSRRRSDGVALARQVGMYLAYRLTHHTHDLIAQRFKKSDHSVSIFARKRIEAMMLANPKFAVEISKLEASFV